MFVMPVGISQRSWLLFILMVTVFCQWLFEPEFVELFEWVGFALARSNLQ
jgi:hypothetical protein